MMIDAGVLQIVAVVAILGFMWTLHRDVSNLRKEVGKDIAEVRKDMADLRQEVGRDISEVRKDMADLRQEVNRDTFEIRKDMAGLRERLVRVEGLLESFVGRPPEPQS